MKEFMPNYPTQPSDQKAEESKLEATATFGDGDDFETSPVLSVSKADLEKVRAGARPVSHPADEPVRAITPAMLRQAAEKNRASATKPAGFTVPEQVILNPLPPGTREAQRLRRQELRRDTWNPTEGQTPVPDTESRPAGKGLWIDQLGGVMPSERTSAQAEALPAAKSLVEAALKAYFAKTGPAQNLLRSLPADNLARREFEKQMMQAAHGSIAAVRQDMRQAGVILGQQVETIAQRVIQDPKYRDAILG